MSLKTEQKIKKFLANLSDGQIKKLFDGVEISPFPVLLTIEYEKRFGKKNKKRLSALYSNLRSQKVKQRKLLRDLHADLKMLEQTSVSLDGIEKLSKNSIEQIQRRRTKLIQNILKLATNLDRINKEIFLGENDLVNMRSR